MALVVAGVHRSGTSMIAGVLSKLGISMGDGAVMNPAPENPEGFFERIDVMELNDTILKNLGGSWNAPPVLTQESWFNFKDNDLARFRNSIDLFSGNFNNWFVKDPRISLILPIWDRLALSNLSLIFTVRNPQAVSQSLHLRNGFSDRRGIALWWAYNQQLLSEFDVRDTLVIDYDAARRSKKATTEKIASFSFNAIKVKSNVNLNYINQDTFQDQIFEAVNTKNAENSIKTKLTRSNSNRKIKGLAKSEIEESMEFYEILKKSHGSVNAKIKGVRTPDWVYEELHSARVVFQLSQSIENLSDYLETSKIEIATLNQLAQNTTLTQNNELDRLKSHLTTLEAERDSAQSEALLLSSNFKKSTQSLTALSGELAQRIGELNLSILEVKSKENEVLELQKRLESAYQMVSVSNQRINDLEKFVSNLSKQLGLELLNNLKMIEELDSIRKSKGYRIISKLWKLKVK